MLSSASSARLQAPLTEPAAHDDAYFTGWRARELSRVERAGLAYLDYTGAALYPESLVRSDAERLSRSVLGNPHSEHAASREASADLDRAREAILAFVGADPAEYEAIVTANATGAMRLVAESFPFGEGGAIALTADNHNSVNGIRERAAACGAELRTIELDDELRLREPIVALDRPARGGRLFAFPAQSNFSGVRHPLTLVHEVRERGWRVLLDAAAFVPTADLNLSSTPADFVALSIYKIAGYPSGVGALVARREALAELRRPWFSGGTVDWVSVRHQRYRLTPGAAGFEDGTVPYLALGAVPAALQAVQSADRERLRRHLARLTTHLLQGLTALTHANGRAVVQLHGPRSAVDRGATAAFIVHDPNGRVIPYWVVEAEAREAGIAVRGGCFCNPGCAEAAFGFADRETLDCFDRLGEQFTIPRFADCLGGKAVGAVRASLGLGSVHTDVDRLLGFLARYADGGAD